MKSSQKLQGQNQEKLRDPAARAGLRGFLFKNRHAFPMIAYLILYLIWFFYLERTVTGGYTIIHARVDDYIPFCEVFVVPYTMWFGYVFFTVLFFCLTDREEYVRLSVTLVIGMTLFLIISTLFPNGHQLRPAVLPRDNIFTKLVLRLWKTDPPTSLWPSVHVYDAMAAHFAIAKSRRFNREASPHSPVRIGSFVLSTLIILSTLFIKQHSVFDVGTGILLGAVIYVIFYRHDPIKTFRAWRNNRPRPQLQ